MALVAILQEVLSISLTAAPWLLLGLVLAGLIKAFVPEAMLQLWIGGNGFGAVARSAIVGAPLPLCSCGAIPTALALHRGGAGRGPTTAFMVATPGIGADSVLITYALLGPVMMVARVAGALVTAISTGLLVAGSVGIAGRPMPEVAAARSACSQAGCAPSCSQPDAPARVPEIGGRLRAGLSYAFGELFDDVGGWMLAGLVVAGVILWAVPPQAAASLAVGPPAMLLMAVIGIPIYICATAATPIAGAMLIAGASPGTVLVFLLAGPVTSMATLAVLHREMGTGAVARYFAGVVGTTVLVGLLVDGFVGWSGTWIALSMSAGREILPDAIEWAALTALVLIGVRPVRRVLSGLAVRSARPARSNGHARGSETS
jgi:uncharacterized protein